MENGTNDPTRHDRPATGEEAVESLLRHASSRPEPSDNAREDVRAAVMAEWQAVTARRRWRRRAGIFSVAASVLLVATMVLLSLNEPSTMPDLQEIARVERISGRVQVLDTESQENGSALGQLMPVYQGQTLKTGTGSGMALSFGSGISVRVDELTEIDLFGLGSLKLNAGRVYVDTKTGSTESVDDNSAKSRFEILTDRGAIRHLGTQYMVLVGEENMSVSVREGIVHVISEKADGPSTLFVENGMKVSLNEYGEAEILPADVFGDQWLWAENLGSGFVLDSRTMAEFLEWVARETGHEIRYESATAESVARETVLHGTVDLPAREALELVLQTSDLSADIVNGVIEIRMKQ
jgi:ferric-dicitrate binding protein FerR (iron transport regulator)